MSSDTLNGQGARELLCPLNHSLNAEMSRFGTSDGLNIKARAVICYSEHQNIFNALHLHADGFRAPVLQGVGERFLADPQRVIRNQFRGDRW